MEREIFIKCSCSHKDHGAWITVDNSDPEWPFFTIETRASLDISIWQRIKLAFRILFYNRVCGYSSMSECIVDDRTNYDGRIQVGFIKSLAEEWLDTYKEEEVK